MITGQNKSHIIRTFEHLKRVSDVFLIVDFIEMATDHESLQKQALNRWMLGVPEMVRDKSIYKENLSKEKIEQLTQQFEAQMANGYKEQFSKFRITILNMNLVMLCTLLEIFFEHVLKTIFDANPKVLLRLSGDKNITLERFLELGSYERVLEEFKEKYIDKALRAGTKETLNLFDKIGINREELFSWNSFTINAQSRFKEWKDEKLVAIFNIRHEIVHEAKYPLIDVKELLLIKDYFDKLILNLSHCSFKKYSKYGLILDLQTMFFPEGAKELRMDIK